jgi:NDP-sugar pyrophosphorylase family protein
MVLAGGFGTRLQTAALGVPKALAPVGDTPFLQLQIQHWIAQGVRSFVFLLYHQADQIIEFLEACHDDLLRGCSVSWTIEPQPMETGGAIAYAVRSQGLHGDFLATNADTWLGGGIRELCESVAPAVAVLHVDDIARYGEVLYDANASVMKFLEKDGRQKAGWINAGLYRLNSKLFDRWNGSPMSLERDIFPQLASRGVLKAVPVMADFVDIGLPDDYERFCVWARTGRGEALL